MRIDCFLDTNVLVYAAAGKRDEPRKHTISRELMLTRDFGVSAQNLAEFYSVMQRKAAIPMPLAEVDQWIDELAGRPFVNVDENIVRAGIYFSRRYRISYYDAAMLAAAERLAAPIFFSEDLSHDQVYGSVRVLNPFRAH